MEKVIIKKSRNGKGVFSKKTFIPNEKIFVIKGKLIACDEEDNLPEKVRDNAFRFDSDRYISPEGELGDYLNHSCEPNSFVYKEKDKLYIVALKKIPKNDEILIDYSTILGDDDTWTMSCNCGEKNCRKIIKKFQSLKNKQKSEYLSLNIVPDYIYEK